MLCSSRHNINRTKTVIFGRQAACTVLLFVMGAGHLCITELLAENTRHCKGGEDCAYLLDQSTLKEYSYIF